VCVGVTAVCVSGRPVAYCALWLSWTACANSIRV
jgi:hypothetical protein